MRRNHGPSNHAHTVCPRSSYPFHLVSYYMKYELLLGMVLFLGHIINNHFWFGLYHDVDLFLVKRIFWSVRTFPFLSRSTHIVWSKSLDPFYVVTCNIKWVKISWTFSSTYIWYGSSKHAMYV